ncbi:MAG: hypothetical protein M3Z66_08870 [Chloroflexota bacterium]|nr:hypothetical protein [Chloroflexota bacterium]
MIHAPWRVLVSIAIGVSMLAFSGGRSAALANSVQVGGGFNTPGNLFVSDQFNNRAIEINPSTNQIVWSFGSGNPALCNPGPGAVIGPNDAERLSHGLSLLAGTGIPPGASPGLPNGCVDNRVIVVNHAGDIIWQYGQAGVTGKGWNQLNVPVFAIQLPDRNIMIVDQGNNRVIVVDRFRRRIVWSYGPTSGPGALNNPNSAELLPNNDVLIADENNSRVLQITPAGKIVGMYSKGLNIVAFASRLPNLDTLITDSGNNRVIEVTPQGQIVFQYVTNTAPGSNPSPLPTNAVRLANNDDTVIADQFNDRVIVVDRDGTLDYQYGTINVPGNGSGQLNAPYTAFVIGDYTGQTPPPPIF